MSHVTYRMGMPLLLQVIFVWRFRFSFQFCIAPPSQSCTNNIVELPELPYKAQTRQANL